MVRVVVKDEAVGRALKVLAAERGVSMQAVVLEAVRAYVGNGREIPAVSGPPSPKGGNGRVSVGELAAKVNGVMSGAALLARQQGAVVAAPRAPERPVKGSPAVASVASGVPGVVKEYVYDRSESQE